MVLLVNLVQKKTFKVFKKKKTSFSLVCRNVLLQVNKKALCPHECSKIVMNVNSIPLSRNSKSIRYRIVFVSAYAWPPCDTSKFYKYWKQCFLPNKIDKKSLALLSGLAKFEVLHIAYVVDHFLRILTERVVDVVLHEICWESARTDLLVVFTDLCFGARRLIRSDELRNPEVQS